MHVISMEQLALAYAKAGNRDDAANSCGEIKQANLPNIEQVLVVDPPRKAAIIARQEHLAETVLSATGAMALGRCRTGFPGTAFSNLPDAIRQVASSLHATLSSNSQQNTRSARTCPKR